MIMNGNEGYFVDGFHHWKLKAPFPHRGFNRGSKVLRGELLLKEILSGEANNVTPDIKFSVPDVKGV